MAPTKAAPRRCGRRASKHTDTVPISIFATLGPAGGPDVLTVGARHAGDHPSGVPVSRHRPHGGLLQLSFEAEFVLAAIIGRAQEMQLLPYVRGSSGFGSDKRHK